MIPRLPPCTTQILLFLTQISRYRVNLGCKKITFPHIYTCMLFYIPAIKMLTLIENKSSHKNNLWFCALTEAAGNHFLNNSSSGNHLTEIITAQDLGIYIHFLWSYVFWTWRTSVENKIAQKYLLIRRSGDFRKRSSMSVAAENKSFEATSKLAGTAPQISAGNNYYVDGIILIF